MILILTADHKCQLSFTYMLAVWVHSTLGRKYNYIYKEYPHPDLYDVIASENGFHNWFITHQNLLCCKIFSNRLDLLM